MTDMGTSDFLTPDLEKFKPQGGLSMSEVDYNPEDDAQELTEAIGAIQRFVKMPKDQKVLVVKHVIDKQIGSDPGASLPSIPGLTPELTEAVTDPLLSLAANAIIKALMDE